MPTERRTSITDTGNMLHATAARAGVVLLACTVLALLLPLQSMLAQSKRDPFTPDEVEQLRKLAYQPDDRVELYGKLLHERLLAMQMLLKTPETSARDQQIHDRMEDIADISDEFEDTLSDYQGRHMDMRKGLKKVIEESPHWESALKLSPSNRVYDFARTEAMDATSDLHDSLVQVLAQQEKEAAAEKLKAKEKSTEFAHP